MSENKNLRPIPQLNHDELLSFVRGCGGKSDIVTDGSGFWLIWRPEKEDCTKTKK